MSYPSVRRWLEEHTSLEPSLLEGAGFDTLVAERLSAVGGGTESDYIAALNGSADEVDRLTGGIAVPETWFFRYHQSFSLLVEFLERRLHMGLSSLRMLSVGCATGEEPYSMAMAALRAGWPPGSISIDAHDRNAGVLRRAAAGEYPLSSIRSEVPLWATPFLLRVGNTIAVDPAVRALVRFTQTDVTQPGAITTGSTYDVIFCRNVLIYLGAAARKRLFDSICTSLAPGGMLFVGHAEQLLCSTPPLRSISAPHAFALTIGPSESAPASPRPAPSASFSPPYPSPPPNRIAVQRPTPPLPRAETEPTLDDARALANAGRVRECEALVHAIIARRGPSSTALELLGMVRMASNDAAGARVFFEQAVYLEPTRAPSLVQLAILSEHSGDPRRAATFWDRARRASITDTQERAQ